MKFIGLIPFALGSLLFACTGEQVPKPDAQLPSESVSLVLYYSDGDFDLKTTGEMVLLNTGEIVTIQRNRIRPDARLMTSDWNNKFLLAFHATPTNGSQDLKLDRTNGRLCNTQKCALVYSICPPHSSLNLGGKCHSYPLK
jgi:hypothetical protein